MSNGATQPNPIVVEPQPGQTLTIQPAPTVNVTVTTSDPLLMEQFTQLANLVTTFDAAIQALNQSTDQKAPVQHLHSIANVSGLQAALDALASTMQGITISSVSGLSVALADKAPLQHLHSIANVSGLQAALDDLAATPGGGTISSIEGLSAALDGKANVSHVHDLANVTGLAAALDGKADATHAHSIAGVMGLQAALDDKASMSHSHPIGTVEGLAAALDGKAAANHGHSVAAIAGLQATIDSLQSQISNGSAPIAALNYTVSQSSVATTWAATQAGTFAMLTDGSYTTGTFTNSSSSDWVQFDLGSEKEVTRIGIGGGAVTNVANSVSWLSFRQIQASFNGLDWVPLLTLPDITADRLAVFSIPAVRCRFLRLAGQTRVSLSEFYVWGR